MRKATVSVMILPCMFTVFRVLNAFWITFLFLLLSVGIALPSEQSLYEVGVAKVDITPSYPIRLCGYAVRKTESQGIAQHLYAKAVAVGSDEGPEGPAILLTV